MNSINPETEEHLCSENCLIKEGKLSPYEMLLIYNYYPTPELWGAIKLG